MDLDFRMAKPLLDAIVALPTDDPPLALAAAAVLYFLAIDVILFPPCKLYKINAAFFPEYRRLGLQILDSNYAFHRICSSVCI
jgi:hypothetical protein